jgi:hypothetical protein
MTTHGILSIVTHFIRFLKNMELPYMLEAVRVLPPKLFETGAAVLSIKVIWVRFFKDEAYVGARPGEKCSLGLMKNAGLSYVGTASFEQ